MKKHLYFTIAFMPIFIYNCLPQEKQSALFSPELISLLDSLGVDCQSNEMNLSPCDSACLSVEWIVSKTENDSLLLITDKNCYGSGDMRSWICKVDRGQLYAVQSFVTVQSITEDTSGNLFPDLFITHRISPDLSPQKEAILLRYVFANGLYVPKEVTTLNTTHLHLPVNWLEFSGKNIDGGEFFVKHKANADTLQLKNFNKVQVSESLWILSYIDAVRFVAHSWLIETNVQSDRLLVYLPGKIISPVTDTTNTYPEFNLSFFSVADSIKYSGLYYRWTGSTYKSISIDTNCYYYGEIQTDHD